MLNAFCVRLLQLNITLPCFLYVYRLITFVSKDDVLESQLLELFYIVMCILIKMSFYRFVIIICCARLN